MTCGLFDDVCGAVLGSYKNLVELVTYLTCRMSLSQGWEEHLDGLGLFRPVVSTVGGRGFNIQDP